MKVGTFGERFFNNNVNDIIKGDVREKRCDVEAGYGTSRGIKGIILIIY